MRSIFQPQMAKRSNRSTLARNLRTLRVAKGMTQRELNEAAGVTNVGAIEAGLRKSPEFKSISAIAAALGVPADALYDDENADLHPALEEFLESRMVADISDDELRELKRMHWTGGEPTRETYYLALKMIRSVDRDE